MRHHLSLPPPPPSHRRHRAQLVKALSSSTAAGRPLLLEGWSRGGSEQPWSSSATAGRSHLLVGWSQGGSEQPHRDATLAQRACSVMVPRNSRRQLHGGGVTGVGWCCAFGAECCRVVGFGSLGCAKLWAWGQRAVAPTLAFDWQGWWLVPAVGRADASRCPMVAGSVHRRRGLWAAWAAVGTLCGDMWMRRRGGVTSPSYVLMAV